MRKQNFKKLNSNEKKKVLGGQGTLYVSCFVACRNGLEYQYWGPFAKCSAAFAAGNTYCESRGGTLSIRCDCDTSDPSNW